MNTLQLKLIFIGFVLFSTACNCDENVTLKEFTPQQKMWLDSVPMGNTSFIAISSFGETDSSIIDKENGIGEYSESRTVNCDRTIKYDTRSIFYFVEKYLIRFEFSSENTPEILELNIDNYGASSLGIGRTTLYFDQSLVVRSNFYFPFQSIPIPQNMQITGDTLIKGTTYSDLNRIFYELPSNANPSFLNKLWISKAHGLIAFQLLNGKIWYIKP